MLRAEENRDSNVNNVVAPSTMSSDGKTNTPRSTKEATNPQSRTLIPSPVQLNFVEQLPASSNVDCVSLGGILGDPLIKECWLFNYLFNVDFVM